MKKLLYILLLLPFLAQSQNPVPFKGTGFLYFTDSAIMQTYVPLNSTGSEEAILRSNSTSTNPHENRYFQYKGPVLKWVEFLPGNGADGGTVYSTPSAYLTTAQIQKGSVFVPTSEAQDGDLLLLPKVGNEAIRQGSNWSKKYLDNGLFATSRVIVSGSGGNYTPNLNQGNRFYISASENVEVLDPDSINQQSQYEVFVYSIKNISDSVITVNFSSITYKNKGGAGAILEPLDSFTLSPLEEMAVTFQLINVGEVNALIAVNDINRLWAYQAIAAGGGAQMFTQIQPSHGFTPGQLIYFHNAATAELAKSDVGIADSVAQWAVHTVVNDSTFTYCNTCEVPLTTGFTPGSYVWTDTIPGAVTNVQPTLTNCQYAGVVRTDSTVWVHVGDLCGGKIDSLLTTNTIYNASDSVANNDQHVKIKKDNTFSVGYDLPYEQFWNDYANGTKFSGMFNSEGYWGANGFANLQKDGDSLTIESYINIKNDGEVYLSSKKTGTNRQSSISLSENGISFSGSNSPYTYGFPQSSPSITNLSKSVMTWTGNGSTTTPAFEVQPKKYVANITSNGTGAPTMHVFDNTFGASIVWTRTGVGVYQGTLSGAFTVNKTWMMLNDADINNCSTCADIIYRVDADTIEIQIFKGSGLPADIAFEMSFEIRVYP